MQELSGLFTVLVVLMSVVVHEVAHGYAALRFGDRTALLAGRLTLNPLKHLDPIGSVVLPLLLIFSHAPFPFGWARPVPYNPNNLSDRKWGTIVVAFAGVGANFLLALAFSIVLRASVFLGFLSPSFIMFVSLIILVNISLGIFNLIPVPPLDGSRIFFALMPSSFRSIEQQLEQYAFPIVLILMVLLWKFDFISPLIHFLYTILTGVGL